MILRRPQLWPAQILPSAVKSLRQTFNPKTSQRTPMADKATVPHTNIHSVLQEQRKFECPEEFRRGAHIKSAEDYDRIYRESVDDPEKFWGRIANELHWFKKWDKVLEWKNPWAKWFVGGEINLSYNCL